VTILLLKLTITPVVIAAATLAARRFGPAVGGWLIGLPVTAGPVALFLALEHGSAFASRVATGLVAGVSAQAAFVLGYVFAARRGGRWPAAVAAGSASFLVVGLAVDAAGLPALPLLVLGLVALAAGLWLVPAAASPPVPAPPPWDLPLRMVLATGLVLAITGFASTLGPGLSGTATTYPLLSTLVAVFVHRSAGAPAAVAVYRGLLVGLFALIGFATTLAVLLSRLPLGLVFTLAVALTLAIQLGSLQVMRRTAVEA
jgi:hypothetical protein